jgi:hypothetical protein
MISQPDATDAVRGAALERSTGKKLTLPGSDPTVDSWRVVPDEPSTAIESRAGM